MLSARSTRGYGPLACGFEVHGSNHIPNLDALRPNLTQCALLDQLASEPWDVVPVFIADHGLSMAAVQHACRLPFPALMADTENKTAGSLFDCLSEPMLTAFIAQARRAGKLVGLSGALRTQHLPRLAALNPDFAGFRSALCEGGRGGAFDPMRLRELKLALAMTAASVELAA